MLLWSDVVHAHHLCWKQTEGYYWKLHSLIRKHQVQWGYFNHEVMLCVIFPLSSPSLPQISKWVEFKGIITSINRISYNLHDGTCSVGDEHLIQWEKSWPGGWSGDADEDAARGGPVSILPFGQNTDEWLPFVTLQTGVQHFDTCACRACSGSFCVKTSFFPLIMTSITDTVCLPA